MMALDARTAVEFALSGGQCHDAPQGRLLMDPASHVIAFKVDPDKYRVNYMPKTGASAMMQLQAKRGLGRFCAIFLRLAQDLNERVARR